MSKGFSIGDFRLSNWFVTLFSAGIMGAACQAQASDPKGPGSASAAVEEAFKKCGIVRKSPWEPAERDSEGNRRAAMLLNPTEQAEWCRCLKEWEERELDRTAREKVSQVHICYALEVIYNLSPDDEAESLAHISWMILMRHAAEAGERTPASLETPKWNVPKWDRMIYDPPTGATLEDRVRQAYRSTRTIRQVKKEPRWPKDPLDVQSFDATIRVAELLGNERDEWLRSVVGWAKREFAKGESFRGFYTMPLEYVYSLADDESLASDAYRTWVEMKRVEGKAPDDFPIIVRVRRKGSDERLTWIESVCFLESEVAEWNRDAEPDERVKRRRFERVEECWTDDRVESVSPLKRSAPKKSQLPEK